jgi:hypothetical protein
MYKACTNQRMVFHWPRLLLALLLTEYIIP